VIPGSHRKRHALHNLLPEAHSQAVTDVEGPQEVDPALFADVPDAIDVPLSAGDLIVGDARLLHSAWPNTSDVRRTWCGFLASTVLARPLASTPFVRTLWVPARLTTRGCVATLSSSSPSSPSSSS
jgi:hypothetical protein